MSYTREEYICKIENATPVQLLVITFELCLANLKDAKETDNVEEQGKYIRKAQDFLMQLMTSLDMDYEISDNLLNIYLYVNKILHESYFNGDVANIHESITILDSLLESFDILQQEEIKNATDIAYQNLEYKNGKINEYVMETSSNEYKA